MIPYKRANCSICGTEVINKQKNSKYCKVCLKPYELGYHVGYNKAYMKNGRLK